MKKRLTLTIATLLFSTWVPMIALASENPIMIGKDDSQISDTLRGRSLNLVPEMMKDLNEPFETKTEAEREALPEKDQEVISKIEKYLEDNSGNKNARNFGPTLNKLIAELVFNVTVRRQNTIFNITDLLDITGTSEQNDWFDQVSNKSERTLTVYDEVTQSDITLQAHYVDNQSDKTAVVQHGYRSNSTNIMKEAEFLYNLGYNVIIPDARSHGRSEGSYISFGAYEKEDINQWINQELVEKPEQKIVLFGVSMGAATVMMSQETPHPNVQALIEDCGYYSIEQQARDVMRLITSKLQYIPLVNFIDWYECEDELLDTLNQEFVKPILKVDLKSISPLNAVTKSNIPKLFIHGTADWFIPPIASQKLYDAALGYKEHLFIEGAGHAENIGVGGDLYKNKVRSFLETVSQMTSLRPTLADSPNLLLNTEFKRNQAHTSFENWELSSNGKDFQSETSANSYEFILKKKSKYPLSTISVNENGLRFYKRETGSAGYIGQNVELLNSQNYELSFDVWNPNYSEYSQQIIKYGTDNNLKSEKQTARYKNNKKIIISPTETKPHKITLGSEMTYTNLFGKVDTIMYFTNVKLINSDITAPNKISTNQVEVNANWTQINGSGEPETMIQVITADGTLIVETKTNDAGLFSIKIPRQDTGTILHLINQDIKGNTSESIVLVSR